MRPRSYWPRKRMPPASSARARTLTARMRRVIGESRRSRPCRCSAEWSNADGALATRAGRSEERSGSAVAVSDAIERFDLSEFGINRLELSSEPFDVAVDRAVVDVDVLAVCGIHELVAALHIARPYGEGPEEQKFRDGQRNRLAVPTAEMTSAVEQQLSANDRLVARLVAAGAFAELDPTEQGADPLDQKALGERLRDVIVRSHSQPENLVHLVVLGGQEDDGQSAFRPDLLQKLHAVEAGHFDVQYGQIGGRLPQSVPGLFTVDEGSDLEALRF